MPAQTHGPTWGAKSSRVKSAVYLHLKHEGHSFEDSNVPILAREERWFERGVKEIPSLLNWKNWAEEKEQGGGCETQLPAANNAVQGFLSGKFHNRSPAISCGDQDDPHHIIMQITTSSIQYM